MSFSPLDWTANHTEDPAVASNLRAFRTLLLVNWAIQNWAWFFHPPPEVFAFPPSALGGSAVALSWLVLLSLSRGRLACQIAVPLILWEVVWLFPHTANHWFLFLLVIALFAWLDVERADERDLLLQTLRWMTVIVFFWAGLQKVIHGLYFRGEFLSWMIGQGVDRWATIFSPIVPTEEILRLQSFDRYAVGAGPYRVDSPLFVMASNFVWIAEMGIAAAMLRAGLRRWAALAAIGLTFTIQLAPREFIFALGYTHLLLIAVPGNWNRRLFPLFAAIYVLMLVALLGGPGSFLLKAGEGL